MCTKDPFGSGVALIGLAAHIFFLVWIDECPKGEPPQKKLRPKQWSASLANFCGTMPPCPTQNQTHRKWTASPFFKDFHGTLGTLQWNLSRTFHIDNKSIPTSGYEGGYVEGREHHNLPIEQHFQQVVIKPKKVECYMQRQLWHAFVTITIFSLTFSPPCRLNVHVACF